ncbi:hypothetical protein CD351_05310 [Erythrobacter sp. KY5]|uniref:hypothetical protein n=1 Tax=Erythrobacter sp. KY5 TaxID=2011159 RepID=UPI000DBF1E2D|nr:hypothetical protein [Erythrobacter sp. KY5]AWW73842.1 hypothetical protein CD351_05310 [Erythrobacter sp. KY5]
MSIRRRIERLEGPNVINRPPCVVAVRDGETLAEAFDRIEAEHGARPIKPLVVPAWPQTDEERAELMRRFKEQQLRSMAEAKSSRPKKEDTHEYVNAHFLKRS